MKLKLILLIFLTSIFSLNAQVCDPIKQTPTGIAIQTLDVAEDFGFIPVINSIVDSGLLVYDFSEPYVINNNQFDFSASARGGNFLIVDTTVFFWRLSLDIYGDGNFEDLDVLIQTDTATLDFEAEIDFGALFFEEGAIKDMKIEMVSDTSLFGICDTSQLQPNDTYQSFNLRVAFSGGRLTVTKKKKKTITDIDFDSLEILIDSLCPICLPINDSLELIFASTANNTCDIFLDSLFILDGLGQVHQLDWEVYGVDIYDTGSTPEFIKSESYPFAVTNNQSAVLKVKYTLRDTQVLQSSNRPGKLITRYTYDTNCSLRGLQESVVAPIKEIGEINLIIGCDVGNPIHIDPSFKVDTCLRRLGSGDTLLSVRLLDITPEIAEMNIYPNPTFAEVSIDLTLQETVILGVYIYSILGEQLQTIHKYQQLPKGKHQFNTNIGQFPPGIYLIRFVGKNGQYTQKVLKME